MRDPHSATRGQARMGLIGFLGIIGAAVLIHLYSSRSSPSPTLPVAFNPPASTPAPPKPAPAPQAAVPFTPKADFVLPPPSRPAPPPAAPYAAQPPAVQSPPLNPVAVRNGVIRQSAYGRVSLTVVADSSTNYALKLVNAYTNAEVSLFYVSGGTSVQVNVPAGDYYLRGASGTQWYGAKNLFGPGTTRFFKMSQRGDSAEGSRFSFSQGQAYTLTLKGASNGNVSAPSISANEF